MTRNEPIETAKDQQPDYRDIWSKASAEAIFKALIPVWKSKPQRISNFYSEDEGILEHLRREAEK